MFKRRHRRGMKVLFVAAEVAPFSKTGGLGDVSRALPAALARLGHEVLVVTPRYAQVDPHGLTALGEEVSLRFPFGTVRAPLLESRPSPRHRVVFLENDALYSRTGIYGDADGDYRDNARRFGFLALGALAAAEALKFDADVVHLNDWQTGLAAPALKMAYAERALGHAKCIFTIHNLAYQGLFPASTMAELGLPESLFHPEGLEFYGSVNFLKAGLVYADALTTVSRRYAEEIQTAELGCDLDGLLRARRGVLTGILNGADYQEWDPANDRLIAARYSPDALGGKADCKSALRRHFGLNRPGDRPLFGLVSRLNEQKGIDLLLAALPQMLAQDDLDVVLLGNGERRYEDGLHELARRFPGQVGVQVGFDIRLSHVVEAGSDFFLMPSRYEPCGLNQLYSLRYGTPPIVRGSVGLTP